MEACYIVMICSAVVFVGLFALFIVLTVKKRRREEAERSALEAAYADKNLAKMEYDIAFYDDETYRLMHRGGQVTMDEVIVNNSADAEEKKQPSSEGAIFTKIDSEGVEEITGRFKN